MTKVQHCLPWAVLCYCSLPPAGYTPLHVAADAGRASAVAALLGHGADPNTAARSGDTPLHLACHNAHIQAVSVSVSHLPLPYLVRLCPCR